MPPAKRKKQNPEKPARQDKRESRGSLTFLVLVLVILGIIVAILALKEPLARMMIKNPVTSDAVLTVSPPPVPTTDQVKKSQNPVLTPLPATPSPKPEAEKTPRPTLAASPKPKNAITVDGGKQTPVPKTEKPASKQNGPAKGEQKNVVKTPARTQDMKTATVYMVRVDDSGNLNLESVKRKIDFGDSPLINSLNSMLKGPSSTEMNDGLVSVIPQGTRLLSAWVSNGVAFLNFSENFMFNPLGSAGLQAQLKQVVFAACEFPTVEKVQILIEGKKTEYLGGDNVYVGNPLNRKSFK